VFDGYLARWDLLADGDPIATRSARLLPVRRGDRPAMLKIAIAAEERAGSELMIWWGGIGAAAVLAHDGDAVLLERGGGSLLGQDDDTASRIACATLDLLQRPRAGHPPPLVPLDVWCRAIRTAEGGALADSAAAWTTLLAAPRDVCVLHGDAHHGNILDFGPRGWLAIDPKGLIGERGFDYANLLCNPDHPGVTDQARFARQVAVISAAARLEPRRLMQWALAYAGLSAAWFIADGMADRAATPMTVARIAAQALGTGG